MKKMFFAVNKHAGRGMIAPVLADVLSEFTAADYRVTVYMTQKAGELSDIVAQEAENYDMVVCSGGDGTLNETVNGLMQCEKRPPLGYLPAGTTNDVAANLGLPKKILKAAEVVANGIPVPIDIGRFNGRFFDYIAAFGCCVDVAFATPSQAKNTFGSLAYVMEVLKRLPSIKSVHVRAEFDDGVFEDDVMIGMVSNSCYMAGFSIGKQLDASVNDGMMEVIFIRKIVGVHGLQKIVNSYLTGGFADEDGVFWRRVKKLKITTSEPMPWTVDGEYGGTCTEAELENVKHGVHIMAPRDTEISTDEE